MRNAVYCDSSEHRNIWNIIRYCNIYNWLDHGIFISRPTFPGAGWVDFGNDSWWIFENSFYRNASAIPDGGTAIELQKGNSHHILNNFIGGTEPGAMGDNSDISRGIAVMGTYYANPSQPDYIEGNTIRRIKSGIFKGISVIDQNVDIGSDGGNKIGDSLLANAIWCKGSGAYGIYILNHLDHVINIRNNMIANMVDSAWSDGDALVGIGTIRNGNDSYLGSHGEISNNRIFSLKDMSDAAIYTGTYLPAHPKVFGIVVKGRYLMVKNNKIYKLGVLVPENTGVTDTVAGIWVKTLPGDYNDSCTFYNNMISMGYYTSDCHNDNIFGFLDASWGQGNNNYYFNSVNIEAGGISNETSSFCFFRKKNYNVNILNNLFINNRIWAGMPSGEGNYAIGVCNYSGVNSNHNDLYSADPNRVGTVQCGSSPLNLLNWQKSFIPSRDMNSVSVLPSFVSATNLHCAGPEALDNLGICLSGYHDDVDGNARQNPPDLGVNDFTTKLYKTWLGDTHYWDEALNWSPAGVPTTLDNVRLTPGINYSPTIRSDGATCLDLLIEAGVTLSVNPGKYLDIMGGFVLLKYCP